MDENKVRLKFGFDRYIKKNELDDNDETYVLKSKGYTKSSDIYNKILKEKVQKVLKGFYDEEEIPFFIEIEKIKPKQRGRKESTHTIGRPKNTKIPKYRFWVRFNEIQNAVAVEIKDGVNTNTGFDVSHELYLFRITLAEILRVNGCDEKVATDYSQKIADEVKDRSATDPELAYKARKKLEELPRLYEGKKVHDYFKLIQKVLWEFKRLGEDPTPKSKKSTKSKDAIQPDFFWPSDIGEQIGILKYNHQKISKIMDACKVSPEYFEKVMDDFKIRLSKPDKSGSQSMKTEAEAWSYFSNWLKASAPNYRDIVIVNDGDVKTKADLVNESDGLATWSKCSQSATNSQDRGLSMAFQLMYFKSFDEAKKVVNIEVPAFVVRDYVLRYATLRFCLYLKKFFGEGTKFDFTQKWSPGNTKSLKTFEEFYDHVKDIHDTTEIKWRDCQFELSTIDRIFVNKVFFENYCDSTNELFLKVDKETYDTLEGKYVFQMKEVFGRFYGNRFKLKYKIF